MIESTKEISSLERDLTTIVSQTTHQLIEYLVLWLLITERERERENFISAHISTFCTLNSSYRVNRLPHALTMILQSVFIKSCSIRAIICMNMSTNVCGALRDSSYHAGRLMLIKRNGKRSSVKDCNLFWSIWCRNWWYTVTCVFYITNEIQLDGFQPIHTSGRQQESMTIPKAAHTVL